MKPKIVVKKHTDEDIKRIEYHWSKSPYLTDKEAAFLHWYAESWCGSTFYGGPVEIPFSEEDFEDMEMSLANRGFLQPGVLQGKYDLHEPYVWPKGFEALREYYAHKAVSTMLDDLVNDKERTQ